MAKRAVISHSAFCKYPIGPVGNVLLTSFRVISEEDLNHCHGFLQYLKYPHTAVSRSIAK